jgi:hypothetical protein
MGFRTRGGWDSEPRWPTNASVGPETQSGARYTAEVLCSVVVGEKKKPASPYEPTGSESGADRARTDDLLHAITPLTGSKTLKRRYIEGLRI